MTIKIRGYIRVTPRSLEKTNTDRVVMPMWATSWTMVQKLFFRSRSRFMWLAMV